MWYVHRGRESKQRIPLRKLLKRNFIRRLLVASQQFLKLIDPTEIEQYAELQFRSCLTLNAYKAYRAF